MNDDKLLLFSRQLLDNSLKELDDSVLSKLRASRRLAINAAAKNAEAKNSLLSEFPKWLAPVSTGATFATIALTITLFSTQSLQPQNQPNHFMEDLAVLSASEDLELYQNLEFYLWLEDESTS